MPNPQENEAAGFIIGIIFIMGLAIFIARALFPFFLVLSIISFIVLIVVFILDFSNDRFNGYDTPVSFYVSIIFFVLLAGTFLTWIIGYGFAGTSIGQASIEVYNTFVGVEEEISNAFNTAIEDLIEANCKVLDEVNCNLLKQSAETGKEIQELKNLASNLKKAQGLL